LGGDVKKCRSCRGKKEIKGEPCASCVGTGLALSEEERQLELKREKLRLKIREGLMRGGHEE
jgi:DnaJ-class molecular chaperone